MKGLVKKQKKSNSWEFLDMKETKSNNKGNMKLLDLKEDNTVDKQYKNSSCISGDLAYIDNAAGIRNHPLERINLNAASWEKKTSIRERL